MLKLFIAVERFFKAVAVASMIIVMFLISTDVVARYILRSPVKWSYDALTLYLLPCLFFFIVADTQRVHYHIEVDFLMKRGSMRTQQVMAIFTSAASIVLFGLLTILMSMRGYGDFQQGSKFLDGGFEWPVWISSAIAALGFALLTGRLIIQWTRVWLGLLWPARYSTGIQINTEVEDAI